MDNPRSHRTPHGCKCRENFSSGTSTTTDGKLGVLGFRFLPCTLREPARRRHKTRHKGGPQPKGGQVIETTIKRTKQDVRRYPELKGYEILEDGWYHGGDSVDFIATDEDDLVFISCQLRRNSGEGFPKEVIDRDSLERLAAAYLAEHLDSGDCTVRFDAVSMLVLGNDRAFLRHHRNALCEH